MPSALFAEKLLLEQITSLRGISVLSVFLFHLDFIFFKNGFYGVDIFFLISGYVITQSILSKFDGNYFTTIINFYINRFKRIFPNLLFILTVSFIIIIIIIPYEHSVIHIKYYISSIFGISNLLYLSDNKNYFNDLENAFLHTWSLGVELQYYILFPLLFFFYKKNSALFFNLNKKFFFLLFFCFFISLSLYIIFSYNNYLALAFYFPLFRIWEFLCGSIVYFINKKIKKNNLYASLALSLILIIIFFGNSQNLIFVNILIILLTSIYITKYEKKNFYNHKLLNFFGLISYSLYLWHLPIIFLSKYFFQLTIASSVLVLSTSIFLSWLTFNFIETKFKKFISLYKWFYILLIFSITMFFIFSNKVKIKEKILANNYYEKTFNWDSSKRFSPIYSSCVNKIGLMPECFFKDKDNDVLFYLEGNSFMGNFLEMFENSDVIKNAYYKHYHGYNLNSSNLLNEALLLQNKYNSIFYTVVVQNEIDLQNLKKNFENIKKINISNKDLTIKFLILGAIPHLKGDYTPINCLKFNIDCEINIQIDREDRNLEQLSMKIDEFIGVNYDYKILFYKPYFHLCIREQINCKIYEKNSKKLKYRDSTHLTIEGSKLLSNSFDNFLKSNF
jgi:peptidoglycan/LPS O-acetylase OafA/YrhL